ncbi:AraC family transcriptional regulator [Hoyosella sp. YIM 151337]|uniref:helix-turn-helix domain-containing protein n=1 Tax=Hoyosella sp. YIM 151337 TaxID=2992742 RepID=UPI00223587D2|nr:AraC family transcriptional regulator [Hoyosella sp. YIM 151337]MCW4354531.1 AraC family transcriptional regulator [Hoyosella sp. YIM 151337]
MIDVDDVPNWVRGALTLREPAEQWTGPALRAYSYPAHVVDVPAIKDHVVITYRRGSTLMRRRSTGAWTEETLRPGAVSLLTAGEFTQWEWPSHIDVVHAYVQAPALEQTARDAFDREIAGVELADSVAANDPVLFNLVAALEQEARDLRTGTRLVVDALTLQLHVQLLRYHAGITFAPAHSHRGLSPHQLATVQDYVAAHLDRNVGIDELARTVMLSRYHFSRQFRISTGTSVHEWVLRQRVTRAAQMLRRTALTVTEIAHQSGFADQSHLTRVFKKRLGVAPTEYRAKERIS